MSNYVNYVNVSSTSYALGPLMSTASGGIVDNKSGVYSDYNNCIIHGNITGSNLSTVDSNLVINTYAQIAPFVPVSNTAFIGGSGVYVSGVCCVNDTFINCYALYGGGVIGTNNYDNNTFIGLYDYSCAESCNTDMLLQGVNNVVQGYAQCTDAVGLHATATKTLNMYSSYDNNTSIFFPHECCGLYSITVINSNVCDAFRFVVKDTVIQSDFNMYTRNSYYYCSSTGSVGVSIDNACLYLYTEYGDGPTQVTISYDVLPYTGGSDSSSESSSY